MYQPKEELISYEKPQESINTGQR